MTWHFIPLWLLKHVHLVWTKSRLVWCHTNFSSKFTPRPAGSTRNVTLYSAIPSISQVAVCLATLSIFYRLTNIVFSMLSSPLTRVAMKNGGQWRWVWRRYNVDVGYWRYPLLFDLLLHKTKLGGPRAHDLNYYHCPRLWMHCILLSAFSSSSTSSDRKIKL